MLDCAKRLSADQVVGDVSDHCLEHQRSPVPSRLKSDMPWNSPLRISMPYKDHKSVDMASDDLRRKTKS